MFAVVAVYPSGHLVLVGFGRTVDDVNALIEECIAHNGKEKLMEGGSVQCRACWIKGRVDLNLRKCSPRRPMQEFTTRGPGNPSKSEEPRSRSKRI